MREKVPHDILPAGLVNLYKPPGPSSATYAYRLRRVFGIRKIGHAGTLDPFADGVLLVCVGSATKLVEQLMGLPKHYRTTLRLGVTNRSFDTELPFSPVEGAAPPSEAEIEAALVGFRGEIEQVPPVFSAVKVEGVASYHLARRSEAVEGKPKSVRIDRIELLEYAWPLVTMEIHCGRGTYVRGIARDLGKLLGCGACCQTLTRTAVGPFGVDDSVRLQTMPPEQVRLALIPPSQVLDLVNAASHQRPGP
jgi:tRNA pseudouridine55 synthase